MCIVHDHAEGRPVFCVDLPITGVHPIIDDILVAELQ